MIYYLVNSKNGGTFQNCEIDFLTFLFKENIPVIIILTISNNDLIDNNYKNKILFEIQKLYNYIITKEKKNIPLNKNQYLKNLKGIIPVDLIEKKGLVKLFSSIFKFFLPSKIDIDELLDIKNLTPFGKNNKMDIEGKIEEKRIKKILQNSIFF